MPIKADSPAPYAPPKSVLLVIERFRERGLQIPFTKEVLTRAGVSETVVPRTLQSLQLLDLIDEEGNPTDHLTVLQKAKQNEYQERFAEILKAVYQEIFAFADPENDDVENIRDAFRGYTPHGQQDRMVALFLALCEKAGIIPEGKVRTATRVTKKKKPLMSGARRIPTPRRKGGETKLTGIPTAISGLLHSLPTEGTGWSKERRDNFVKAFGTVLDFCFPIEEKKDETNPSDELEESQ